MVYQIAGLANVNGLAALEGVSKAARNITKAEYNKRMPNTSLKHTKDQLIDKIWYILTRVFWRRGASRQWTLEINSYFSMLDTVTEKSVNNAIHKYVMLGTWPEYVNGPENAVRKFTSKRGYWEFMKRLSIENVLGLYCWLNGKYLDYSRVREWQDGSERTQERALEEMAKVLQRRNPYAIEENDTI